MKFLFLFCPVAMLTSFLVTLVIVQATVSFAASKPEARIVSCQPPIHWRQVIGPI
jgi:hypothetical protein